ncbi:MAG TPA: protease pro-enzyme activation domain-containing protein, partial [Chthonomonadales bacterium]|nr:protease pro-enzyme activation domain-containing protein [Chthonomonadales bacterium]
MPPSHVPLQKSEREPLPGARSLGPADPNEILDVTVRVRARQPLPDPQRSAAGRPADRAYLSRVELAEQYGADPADLQKVAAFAAQYGLTVVDSSAARRSVLLSGSVDAFNQAFQVNLQRYEHPGGSYRGRTGPVNI